MGLGYIVKKNYEKHKAIGWAKIKAREMMARDNFIKQQNIVYLNRKHKRGNWCLHKNPVISIRTWAFGSIYNWGTRKKKKDSRIFMGLIFANKNYLKQI
jgi:hypothetical protein